MGSTWWDSKIVKSKQLAKGATKKLFGDMKIYIVHSLDIIFPIEIETDIIGSKLSYQKSKGYQR